MSFKYDPDYIKNMAGDYASAIKRKTAAKAKQLKKQLDIKDSFITPRVGLIDATNLYIRAFSVSQRAHDSQMTDRKGNPTGALYITILAINKIINDLKLTHAFLCWEGYKSQ